MVTGKLYVIFHGAWAFVDNVEEGCDDGNICALAPQVPGHVYMAGSWLGEIQIPRGAHLTLAVPEQICTIQNGASKLGDSTRNHGEITPFPDNRECPFDKDSIQVAVTLPRPAYIHPEMVTSKVLVKFNDCKNREISSPVTLVPVFEYAITVPPTLSGKGPDFFWQPPVTDCPQPITLHLFAAEDTRTSVQSKGDFAAVGALLGCPDVKIETPVNPVDRCADIGIDDLRGREFEITTFLFERVDCLRAIGAQMQARGDKSLYAWKPPLPLPPAPLKSGTRYTADLASCGGGGGGS